MKSEHLFTWLAIVDNMMQEQLEERLRDKKEKEEMRLENKPSWEEVLEKHPDALFLAQWSEGTWISYAEKPHFSDHLGAYVVYSSNHVCVHTKGECIRDTRSTLEAKPVSLATNLECDSMNPENREPDPEPWLTRLKDELNKLIEKRMKLDQFMDTEVFSGLIEVERVLLQKQYQAMLDYENSLFQRVELYTEFSKK